jgi:hypothetical protein
MHLAEVGRSYGPYKAQGRSGASKPLPDQLSGLAKVIEQQFAEVIPGTSHLKDGLHGAT